MFSFVNEVKKLSCLYTVHFLKVAFLRMHRFCHCLPDASYLRVMQVEQGEMGSQLIVYCITGTVFDLQKSSLSGLPFNLTQTRIRHKQGEWWTA